MKNYRREQQRKGTEHYHTPINVLDAPKLDEHDDDVVTDFIDKYVTYSLPNANERPELHALVKKLQTHHHTTTCRKKKGVRCRFNAPWPPSTRTLIAREPGRINANKLKAAKKNH